MPEAVAKCDPHMVDLVCNEVVLQGAKVAWEDIAGQDHAKRMIQELVVWPMQNPHLFTVLHLHAWRLALKGMRQWSGVCV